MHVECMYAVRRTGDPPPREGGAFLLKAKAKAKFFCFLVFFFKKQKKCQQGFEGKFLKGIKTEKHPLQGAPARPDTAGVPPMWWVSPAPAAPRRPAAVPGRWWGRSGC